MITIVLSIVSIAVTILIAMMGWVFAYFRRLHDRIERVQDRVTQVERYGVHVDHVDEIRQDMVVVKRVLFMVAEKMNIPAHAWDK